jgi:aminopeptidase YwaD
MSSDTGESPPPLRRRRRRLLVALGVAGALVLAACSGGAASTSDEEARRASDATPPGPTPTTAAPLGETTSSAPASPTPLAATPVAEATAAAPPPPRAATAAGGPADADRAFAHLQALADIGPRVAASAEERAAAGYLAAQLVEAGYEVAIEPFRVTRSRDASEVTASALDEPLGAEILGGSPQTTAEGALVLVPGVGSADDFASANVGGAVAVVARGTLTFAAKAENAERAGAAALLVVNNEAGAIRGTLGDVRPGIPVLGLTREAGAALKALAATPGPLSLSVNAEIVIEDVESQNVVGRPLGGACGAYLGAHYDSVAGAAGANDNASGSAAVTELARALRGAPGAESLCVVAFGAEEIGLNGSQAFVAAHDVTGTAFMLNFDMVAKITTPMFVRGDAELADYASLVASELGESLPADDFSRFASSDHVSFEDAGVPAITVHSGDDEFIHSPQDDIANVSRNDLARMLRVGEELARRLLAAGGIPRE